MFRKIKFTQKWIVHDNSSSFSINSNLHDLVNRMLCDHAFNCNIYLLSVLSLVKIEGISCQMNMYSWTKYSNSLYFWILHNIFIYSTETFRILKNGRGHRTVKYSQLFEWFTAKVNKKRHLISIYGFG